MPAIKLFTKIHLLSITTSFSMPRLGLSKQENIVPCILQSILCCVKYFLNNAKGYKSAQLLKNTGLDC